MTLNMKHLFCALLLSIFSTFSGYAQKTEKRYLDANDTSKNHYTILYPSVPWKGYVFLVPGFGETAENVMMQTNLPQELAQNGLLTVIPTLQDGVLSFGVDDASQQTLKRIMKEVTAQHKLQDLPLYIGGFSIGGSCALKYAENPEIKPTAVFALDPPLDFERFYNSAKRDIRLSKPDEANQENVYMITRIEKETGGTPETHREAYYRLSPYSFSDLDQIAVKKLVEMPVRIYTEPDVDWWMAERNADFTNMNATECSAFINELNRLGNTRAELITTQNKGYRQPANQRHPHSWSIANAKELTQWLLEQH